MKTQVCLKCNQEKIIELFYFRNDTKKLRGTCNSCYKGYKTSRFIESSKNKERLLLGLLQCTKCKIDKKLTEFHKDHTKATGYINQCKKCRKAYGDENKQKIKFQRIRNIYNLTELEYNKILENQNYKCAICKTDKPAGRNNVFHIDHCHTTNKVRGLLCHHCNVALGSMFDNIESLKSAIIYLENNKN